MSDNIQIEEKRNTPSSSSTSSLTSLTIVSMNLAGCEPSAEAPPTWNKTYVAHVVRQELVKNNPDVLALQECPGPNPETWANDLFQGRYKVMGGVGYAHAGYVLLLVREALISRTTTVDVSTNLPAVMVQIDVDYAVDNGDDDGDDDGTHDVDDSEEEEDPNSIDNDDNMKNKKSTGSRTRSTRVVNICSCHLAPFGGGAERRRKQIQSLLEISSGSRTNDNNSNKPPPLVIAGDTNMRLEEDQVMEGTLKLRDVWKESGEDPTTRYTWDTEDHRGDTKEEGRGGGGGGYFNRYYGEDTRQYKTRYDRIYISDHRQEEEEEEEVNNLSKKQEKQKTKKSCLSLEVSAKSFGLLANRPVNPLTKTHFLSDHF
eukprot:CAMPEP_0172547244 /NCGR_PEP_ID=MMETSP1067-20121228/16824_1 /TAXON_ID=265564 ORGANISM="Thalassiosira punctigera, Strain Tpunct2005C2" /NCGR_SAMPLE_ID=MMETSP1067 /ASSEMBLY_ACC=CAM_ASM_000444 /LENGTH=370 /DNA_ID=CAMNT_0013334301 /DNA_START=170 /DNA_END=1279 /DNA_ORIENTATION=+